MKAKAVSMTLTECEHLIRILQGLQYDPEGYDGAALRLIDLIRKQHPKHKFNTKRQMESAK